MPTDRTASTRRVLRRACPILTAVTFAALYASTCSGPAERPATELLPSARSAAAPRDNRLNAAPTVRVREIDYTSHTGTVRSATVVLPAWYGPQNHPVLPVVISPHG